MENQMKMMTTMMTPMPMKTMKKMTMGRMMNATVMMTMTMTMTMIRAVCIVIWANPRPKLPAFKCVATNAVRTFATRVTGVTSFKPITRFASAIAAMPFIAARATKWINATTVVKWFVPRVPHYCLANFVVAVFVKTVPRPVVGTLYCIIVVVCFCIFMLLLVFRRLAASMYPFAHLSVCCLFLSFLSLFFFLVLLDVACFFMPFGNVQTVCVCVLQLRHCFVQQGCQVCRRLRYLSSIVLFGLFGERQQGPMCPLWTSTIQTHGTAGAFAIKEHLQGL
jgi:hypothetical protein